MERPSIPSSIKRQVLIEAGHRCAIPTCRHSTTEIAHIIPYSKVKKHDYENLIALCPNCHTRFDKGEIDKKSMLIYKKKLVFLSDRYSTHELNVLEFLQKYDKVVVHGHLSVWNLWINGLISNEKNLEILTHDDGTEEVLLFVARITKFGKSYIEKWFDPANDELTY